jgi:hypothetical protein
MKFGIIYIYIYIYTTYVCTYIYLTRSKNEHFFKIKNGTRWGVIL